MAPSTSELLSDLTAYTIEAAEGSHYLEGIRQEQPSAADQQIANRLRGAEQVERIRFRASMELRDPTGVPTYKTWSEIVNGFVNEIYTCNEQYSLRFNLGSLYPVETMLCRRCMHVVAGRRHYGTYPFRSLL